MRLLIPLAAFLAILPLLLHGPSCGHDFDFHLLNWLETHTQLAHLQYPRWAFTPAWNAGEPRFLFYPPLSWLLGAALTAVLPFALTSAAYTFLALTAAGFSLYHLAVRYASPHAATLAAVFYLLNPYMLFTAYERTAYAELLAAAFIPLLFAAVLAPRPTVPGIAIPLALLWLTNAPAAVMSTYALALLAAARLVLGSHQTRSDRRSPSPVQPNLSPLPSRRSFALTTLLGTALGLLLAAFYILPAASERRFVQINMAVIEGMRPASNFLFHHTGLSADALAHDAVLHTASLIACLLLALTASALFAAFRPKTVPHSSQPHRDEWDRRNHLPVVPLTILAAVIAILLTPISLPVWIHLPNLAFLQFPWRLLALLAPIAALAAAIAARTLTLRPALLSLATLALAAILIPSAWYVFDQPCDLPDTPQARAALFHSPRGTEPTDEYTPLDADPDALHPGDPPFWLIPAGASIDTPAPVEAQPGPTPNHLTLNLPAPETLVLNRREYPLWRVELNHSPIPPAPQQRADGLLAIPVPAGRDTVDLTLTYPRDQQAGLALSFLALALLASAALRRKPHRSRFRYTRSV